MFVEFDNIAYRLWDYIIVGSGPAGLYIADQLKTVGSVLVIERGGIDVPTDNCDESYRLDVTGRHYNAYGTRLAGFGGTSNHWDGWSHPISPFAFQHRKGGLGWPIPYQHFGVHLEKAAEYLRIDNFYPSKEFQPITRPYQGVPNIERDEFHVSKPIVRLGARETIKA